MTNTALDADRCGNDEPPLVSVRFAEPCPDVLVARVNGKLDLCSAPELDRTLRTALHRSRPSRLLVELSGMGFLGLHGTAVFERLRRDATANGIALSLVAIPPPGQRALKFAGLLPRFDQHPDLPTALAARLGATTGTARPDPDAARHRAVQRGPAAT